MSSKPKMGTGAGVRRVNALLRDVEYIQYQLDGKKPEDSDRAKLDEFQKQKLDLTELLGQIKEDIKTQQTIEQRVGSNAQTIRLKHQIDKSIQEAKDYQSKLETQYEMDMSDYDHGNSKLNSEEMKQRDELCQLLKQDLNYTEHQYAPNKSATRGGGFQLARQARENRKKKRDGGLVSEEPVPLTANQQAFIQESIQRDHQLDDKLDIIKMGVKQLGAIGEDINDELDKHTEMLKEVEIKMDAVQEKLESRNKQLKELLAKTGGMTRWCPVMVLFIVLLACLGYIYNAFIA